MVPQDVNNLFITNPEPAALLRAADEAGVPRNLCAWTRGLYGATIAHNLKTIVVVPRGDCTNNVTMAELLERVGIKVIRFNYPIPSKYERAEMERELALFAKELGTTLEAASTTWDKLKNVRFMLRQIDEQGVAGGQLEAARARLLLLESTDFGGNPELFSKRLSRGLEDFRPLSAKAAPRIAVFGIPAILGDLAESLEKMGASPVLWETERDFAMVEPAQSLVHQYLNYAYPRGLEARLEKFLPLLQERHVDGVLLNAQAFCHHNLELKRVEQALASYPTLVLESDAPGGVSPRDRVRLEGFLSLASARLSPPANGAPSSVVGRRAMAVAGKDESACVGLDLGSRFAKVMARTASNEFRWSMDTVAFYRRFASRIEGKLRVDLPRLLAEMGVGKVTDPRVVATGYGRNLLDFDNARILPEMEAHARGASHQVEDDHFLLVDWGGQDTKIVEVKDGRLVGFVMNDKCAAGSGRYVENMARLLNEPLDAVLSHSSEPVSLTNICATFGESEVIGHLVEGVPVASICAGIIGSVATRTAQLLARMEGGAGLPLHLAGGLAHSVALHELLQQATGRPASPIAEPRYNGALGCLLDAEAQGD
jgi:predicted CoA-substrate-specific enzyme activase